MKLLLTLLILGVCYAQAEETTSNLVSRDFNTGWTGTNLSSTHGSTTIAGVNGNYVESNSISLNESNISKESLNQGFTVNGSAEYWFWSGYNASVTQTIKTVDDNGNILTQTRVVTGTTGSYNILSDQLIVSSNTQQDYNISLRYDFADSSGYNSHYSADLKNPSLTVTYSPITLDSTTETLLVSLDNDIKGDIKNDNFIINEKSVSIKEEDKVFQESQEELKITDNQTLTETVSLDTFSNETIKDDNKSKITEVVEVVSTDNKSVAESKEEQEVASIISEVTNEESKDDKKTEEIKEESNSKTTSDSNVQNESSKEQKEVRQEKTESVRLDKVLDKIDEKIKDIDKNLKLKNIVKINVMRKGNNLNVYNIPFYKADIIYENQLNIQDQRIIYTRVLSDYMINDPIVIQKEKLRKIYNERNDLIAQLEVLKQ